MKNPYFSVVIPLFNKASHIKYTLESVLAQRYRNYEIIVVDDGSCDGGVDIVEAMGCAKLRVIRQDNQGVSAARNRGIASAKGSHIAFLDADDQWTPLYLEEMLKLIVKFPEVGVYATRYQRLLENGHYQDPKIVMQDVDPTGDTLTDFFEVAGLGDLPFMVSSMVVARERFSSLGGFPVGEVMGEDQDFMARAAIQGPIAYSPGVHLLYRIGSDNSACQRHVPTQECGFSRRMHSWVKQYGVKTPLGRHILRYCAAHLCHLAKLNIKAGKLTEAKALLGDYRCQMKPKHKIALSLWCLAAQIIRACSIGQARLSH